MLKKLKEMVHNSEFPKNKKGTFLSFIGKGVNYTEAIGVHLWSRGCALACLVLLLGHFLVAWRPLRYVDVLSPCACSNLIFSSSIEAVHTCSNLMFRKLKDHCVA